MIKQEDEKDLLTIHYKDLTTANAFFDWFIDNMMNMANIVFKDELENHNYTNEELKDKTIVEDLSLMFRLENEYDDDFDITICYKIKDDDEWEYLDNIQMELYNTIQVKEHIMIQCGIIEEEYMVLTINELREKCKNMSTNELLQTARNEHLWALGSDTNKQSILHEYYADCYLLLANEKQKE